MNDQNQMFIGVTGHRDVRPCDEEKLKKRIRKILQNLKVKYEGAELILLDSMAEGADLLCFEAAKEEGVKIRAVLPMAEEEYRKDFSESEARWQDAFDTALRTSDEVMVSPDMEQKMGTEAYETAALDSSWRDYHYRQAGIYVAANSDYLIALWDGKKGKPDGCGTAETVGFFRTDYLKDETNGRNSRKTLLFIHIKRAGKKAGKEN